MYRIIVPYAMFPEVLDYLRQYAQVDCFNDKISQAELMEIIDQYDAIMHRGVIVKINEELVRRASKLKVIGVCRVGLDDVAVKFARGRGIAVFNSGDSSAHAVAETTFFHLLNLSRRFVHNMNLALDGRWKERTPVGSFELCNRKLGVIGFGNIGRKVAAIAHAFGMQVQAFDPFIQETEINGVPLVDLDTLLKSSDYVTVHCPLTEQTRNLIDKTAMEKMKQGAYLVNMARGHVVDEDALYDALVSGHLAGAGLDALASEPMEKGYKLSLLGNVSITPHIGDCAENTQVKIAMNTAKKVLAELGCI